MSSKDPIDQIKQALNVESVIRSQASDWATDTGGDRVARCTHPIHGHTSNNDDGSPNMIVTEDDAWYCYSHGTGGGIFEWVAVEEGVCSCRNLPLTDDQFKEALNEAADRAGVDLSGGVDYEDLSDEQRALHALDTATDILHDNLDAVVGGVTIRHKVKEQRGFTDKMVDEAKVGFLDDQSHAELLEELSHEQLQSIGFHDDSGSLKVRNRIIYPYIRAGRPKYWVGRRTDESPKQSKYHKPQGDADITQPIYKYTPTETDLKSQDVWVVEGIQDAITTAEEGGVRALSPVATNPSTEQFNQLIEEVQVGDRVVVCYDSDDAGDSQACDMALKLMTAGLETYIASVPGRGDPNDYLQGDGEFSDLRPELAAVEIADQHGNSEAILRDICSTVEPNTPRSDMMVDALASGTPFRKKTLRKMVREQHHTEDQHGWMEPERIEKTAGVDTEWKLIYPDGTEIVMDKLLGRRASQEFCNKYASQFNFLPNLDTDEWVDTVNGWLEEVAVTEVSPLSKEALARENVAKGIRNSGVLSSWKDALQAPQFPAGFGGDDTLYVESEAISEWTDDDHDLREVSEYLDIYMEGGTEVKRSGDVVKRMWPLDVDSIEDDGYSIPDPDVLPDDPSVEPDKEVEDV